MNKNEEFRRMVGRNIRCARVSRGLSQEALARKCSCDRSTLSRYENGNDSPTVDILNTIATGLNLDIEDLLSEKFPTCGKSKLSDILEGIDSLRSGQMILAGKLEDISETGQNSAKTLDRLTEYFIRMS